MPTIGIGGGADGSGRVLVNRDVPDIAPERKARFVKSFLAEAGSAKGAIEA